MAKSLMVSTVQRRRQAFRLICAAIGGSALTAAIDVPKGRSADAMRDGHPVDLCAGSNTISGGGARLRRDVEAFDIFLSARTCSTIPAIPIAGRSSSSVSSAWPTWRPKAGVEGKGRFASTRRSLQMTKADIIREGNWLGVDYASDA